MEFLNYKALTKSKEMKIATITVAQDKAGKATLPGYTA
jgi:hypothetical protein